jgi:hypothetical protein
MTHFTETCVDCDTPPTARDGFCDGCRVIYNGPHHPLVGDECPCRVCQSDMAGLWPCENREANHD